MDFKLRKWKLEDIPDVAFYANNEKIAANLRNVFPYPYTEQDAEAYVVSCVESSEERQLCRAIEVEGKAVGSVGVFCGTDVYEKSAELGYWLAEEFWGKGIMTQVVKQICRKAFEKFDIVRIYAEPFANNAGSKRVLEKAGFQLEGIMKNGVCKKGSVQDYCMYALLRDACERDDRQLALHMAEQAAVAGEIAELAGKAGMKSVRKLLGEDEDWQTWFMEYVPENVSDFAMLGILSLLSVKGISKKDRNAHRVQNDAAWKEYRQTHGAGRYIEDQGEMKNIVYGCHFADYNACEVIAAYNALQFLTDGVSPQSFPELLECFEKDGIAANGEFGTSPEALDCYFEKNGYCTKMLVGNMLTPEGFLQMAQQYDTYIFTTYNNKKTLKSMIHTMSITMEDGLYVMHNDYAGTQSYPSLAEAVTGYKGGKGKPICLLGIKRKNSL